MKILDFRLTPVKTALKKPFVTHIRRVETIEAVLLTLICDDGSIGFGEAPPTVAITGEDIESIKRTISQIILPAIYDIDIMDVSIFERIDKCIPKHTSAKACVDMALYDILARASKMPLCTYLGSQIKTIQTDLTISLGEHDLMLRDASEAYNHGFSILKIKLGADSDESIKIVKSIRSAMPNAILRLDANQAWDVKNALKIIDNVANCNIELIEQPVLAEDLVALAEITKHSSIPILADESVFGVDDAKKILDSKIADYINIKLMKCGGIYNAKKIAKIATEYGSKVMIGSMLESVVSISAALHFALSEDVVEFYDLDSPHLACASAFPHSMIFDKDKISLVNTNGLGIG